MQILIYVIPQIVKHLRMKVAECNPEELEITGRTQSFRIRDDSLKFALYENNYSLEINDIFVKIHKDNVKDFWISL